MAGLYSHFNEWPPADPASLWMLYPSSTDSLPRACQGRKSVRPHRLLASREQDSTLGARPGKVLPLPQGILFHAWPPQIQQGPGEPGQGQMTYFTNGLCKARHVLRCQAREEYIQTWEAAALYPLAGFHRVRQALECQAGEAMPPLPGPGVTCKGSCAPSSVTDVSRAEKALGSQARKDAPPSSIAGFCRAS